MAATATQMDKQPDLRKVPGDNLKFPAVHHVVRIVVVPSGGVHAPASDVPSDSHDDLTPGELSDAEAKLKAMNASSSFGTSSTATNMLAALDPTDIVVLGRKVASVRNVDSHGNPVPANPTTEAGQNAPQPKGTHRLFAHNHEHRDTVLRVWTESDTIEYQCDRPFEVAQPEVAGWRIYDSPENLFERSGDAPYVAKEIAGVTPGTSLWSWTSSVIPAKADNQQYKMTFKIFEKDDRNREGRFEEIDPDVVCGNPPPTP